MAVLSVTNVTITLQITAPSDHEGLSIEHYTIYIDKSDRPKMTRNASSDRMEIVIGDLDPKTAYTFVVRASNGVGLSKAAMVTSMTDGILTCIDFLTLDCCPLICHRCPWQTNYCNHNSRM